MVSGWFDVRFFSERDETLDEVEAPEDKAHVASPKATAKAAEKPGRSKSNF